MGQCLLGLGNNQESASVFIDTVYQTGTLLFVFR